MSADRDTNCRNELFAKARLLGLEVLDKVPFRLMVRSPRGHWIVIANPSGSRSSGFSRIDSTYYASTWEDALHHFEECIEKGDDLHSTVTGHDGQQLRIQWRQ